MAFARAPASSPRIQLFDKKRSHESNIGAPFGIANKSPLLCNKRVVVNKSFIAVQGQARPQRIVRQTLINRPTPYIAAQRQPLSRKTLRKETRRGFGTSLPQEKLSAGGRVTSLGALSLSEASVELSDPSEFLSAESPDFEDEFKATMLEEKSNVGWSQESDAQSTAPKSFPQENIAQKAEEKKADSWVPRRLSEAAVHFLKQPSVLLSLAAIAAVAAVRSRFPWKLADGPVILIMAAWWAFFEWFLHAKLLHSNYNWFGRGIHKRHHEAPFHHVSIDGLDLVAISLVGFAGFCFALFGKSPLALTGTLTVYTMGLVYEWTHYLVHTKVPMRSYIGSMIKRAHVSHHLKDQRYWLSFTCPPIDVLMGTTPEGGQGVTPVT